MFFHKQHRHPTHLKKLLHKPAVIPFEGYFIGFGDVDSDEVWVAVILFTIH